MIVKDEERYLEGCLQSVRGLVDEIILVDTGSTDRTVDIARRSGAAVYSFTWRDDFSAARNESLERATGEWVLYLDADERLAPCQESRLRALLTDADVGAYLLTIEGDHHLPTGIVHQVNTYPRLFRRLPSVRFEGKVHEQIAPSILRTGRKIVPSSVVIHHLGYAESVEAITQKCERNIHLLRRQLQREPHNGYLRYHIGNTLTVLGRYGAARRELEGALREKQIPAGIRASLLNLLAEINLREDKPAAALQQSRASLELVPSQVLGQWLCAAAEIALGAFANALSYLQNIEALQSDPSRREMNSVAHDVIIDPARLNFQQAICYENLGDDGRAFDLFTKAYEQQPSLADCRDRISQCIPYLNNIQDALAFADRRPEFLYPVLRRGIEIAVRGGQYSEAIGYLDRLGTIQGVALPEGFARRLRNLQAAISPTPTRSMS